MKDELFGKINFIEKLKAAHRAPVRISAQDAEDPKKLSRAKKKAARRRVPVLIENPEQPADVYPEIPTYPPQETDTQG
jgi:hypothetical protein